MKLFLLLQKNIRLRGGLGQLQFLSHLHKTLEYLNFSVHCPIGSHLQVMNISCYRFAEISSFKKANERTRRESREQESIILDKMLPLHCQFLALSGPTGQGCFCPVYISSLFHRGCLKSQSKYLLHGTSRTPLHSRCVVNAFSHFQPCPVWSLVCCMTLPSLASLSTWEWVKEKKDDDVGIDPALGHRKKTHMQQTVIKLRTLQIACLGSTSDASKSMVTVETINFTQT